MQNFNQHKCNHNIKKKERKKKCLKKESKTSLQITDTLYERGKKTGTRMATKCGQKTKNLYQCTLTDKERRTCMQTWPLSI